MAELSIDPDYLRMLIVQVRGLMAKVPPELPDDGSNPTDDPIPPADLQDEEGGRTTVLGRHCAFSSGPGLVAVKARNSVSISGETEVKWIEKYSPSPDAAPSTLPYSVPGISSPLLPIRRILRLLKVATGVSSRTSAAL